MKGRVGVLALLSQNNAADRKQTSFYPPSVYEARICNAKMHQYSYPRK
jgi:hypothetical protein